MLEVNLAPGLVLFIRERSALDIAAIVAHGEIYITLDVKMAKEPDCGLFLAAAATEWDPLIERKALEPIAICRAFLAYKPSISFPEGFNLNLGPQ